MWLLSIVAVSGVGVVVMSMLLWFFVNSRDRLANLLSWLFFSEMIIYLTTIAAGCYVMFGLQATRFVPIQAVEIVRLSALMVNVWAAFRLYQYFRHARR